MPKARQYEVYDLATDELLVTGKSEHCSEVLGIGRYAVCDIARGKYNSRKYRVVDITPPEKKKAKPKNDQNEFDHSAAKQWDAFCAPLRKKYGIPVYKGEKK